MGKPQKTYDPSREQSQAQAKPFRLSCRDKARRSLPSRRSIRRAITQGANIQFNRRTMEVAGNNLTDDHHTL
jgi:hypothetical protein